MSNNSAPSSEADSGCSENNCLFNSQTHLFENCKTNLFDGSKSKSNGNERKCDHLESSSKNSSHFNPAKLSHNRSNARNNGNLSASNNIDETKMKPKKVPAFDLNSSSFPPLPGSISNEVLNLDNCVDNCKASDKEDNSWYVCGREEKIILT